MTIVYVLPITEFLAFGVFWSSMGKKSTKHKVTPIKKAFGLKVRMRRYELEMTQEELAEKADLHPTYVGSIEKGERNIGLESIVAIAHALKISPKDLMND